MVTQINQQLNSIYFYCLSVIIILGCNKVSPPEDDLCSNFAQTKFTSLSVGISLRHSPKWQVYEFKRGDDPAVGITYFDSTDWEHRYDAQIDIFARSNSNLDSSQVMKIHDLYHKSRINQIEENKYTELISDTTCIISGQLWKKFEYKTPQVENMVNAQFHTEYLYCIDNRVIMIHMSMTENSDIKIKQELECIIESLTIQHSINQNI